MSKGIRSRTGWVAAAIWLASVGATAAPTLVRCAERTMRAAPPRPAERLLERRDRFILESETRDGEGIRYAKDTEEFIVFHPGEIIFYGTVRARTLLTKTGFASMEDYFEALGFALRVGQSIENVAPFQPDSRAHHFKRHGREFGLNIDTPDGAADYEEAAMNFAESTRSRALTLEVTDGDGHWRRNFKLDPDSHELLISNWRQGTIITFYRTLPERLRQDGFVDDLEFLLSQLKPTK